MGRDRGTRPDDPVRSIHDSSLDDARSDAKKATVECRQSCGHPSFGLFFSFRVRGCRGGAVKRRNVEGKFHMRREHARR